jgi:hypothetical protein
MGLKGTLVPVGSWAKLKLRSLGWTALKEVPVCRRLCREQGWAAVLSVVCSIYRHRQCRGYAGLHLC